MTKLKKYQKILIGIGIFLGAWFVIHCAIITFIGLNDNLQKSDIAVVFGNEVQTDGKPSPRLEARLQKTLQLYQQGYFPEIVVSGGFGKEGFDEATVMQNYLITNGVPSNAILLDHNGDNTLATVQNVASIMKNQNLKSVMAISQFYHIARIELDFQKVGLSNIATAHADYFEFRDFYSVPREFLAFYYYIFITPTPS